MKKINKALVFLAITFCLSSIAQANLPDFTVLVEQHSPAVVNISTTFNDDKKDDKKDDGDSGRNDRKSEIEKRLEELFGDEPPRNQENSLGSGFILSSDGYVVTNHHVVNGADEVIVKLSDRRELVAKIIGSDPRSDIALLKLESTDLPVLKTGRSATLKAGEWVVAIGSPFGFDHSVTAGIVSAKGRSLPSENYVPFIQTDVAINPGNSGGPLFNLKGEVVGINSQIYSRTGGFMGLSFAIPIDVAMDVIEQLKSKGKVSRGWLGVVIQEVTRELAKSFNIDEIKGALVSQVLDDSPSKGFLMQGDIIVEFDGKEVPTVSELPVLVGRTSIDKEVAIKVIRNGKAEIVKMKIGELPEDVNNKDKPKKEPEKAEKPKELNALGMTLKDLDDDARKELEMEKGGALVSRVKGGIANEAGIRPGDVIARISGTEVESAQHFIDSLKDYKEGDIVALLVRSGKRARFVPIEVE